MLNQKHIKNTRLVKNGALVFIVVALITTAISYKNVVLQNKLLADFPGFIQKEFSVMAQGSFFMPNFPQRISYMVDRLSVISDELIDNNERLKSSIDECDCDYTQSQCKQTVTIGGQTTCTVVDPKGFGPVCPAPQNENDSSIATTQSTINDLTLSLSYFQKLLEKEIEAGLEKQLETLRKDPVAGINDAQELSIGINDLRRTLPALIEEANNSVSLPDQCSADNCDALSACAFGDSFQLKQCVGLSIETSEGKPIELTFRGAVSVKDWELGKVGITNINLNLPDSIDAPELPSLELPSIKITIPEIKIDCPLQSQVINIQTPKPSLPKQPKLELSCPTYDTTGNYQQDSKDQLDKDKYREFNWYLEVFSWLSGQCFESVWGEDGLPDTKNEQEAKDLQESIASCFDPIKTADALFDECKTQYEEKPPDPAWPSCGYWVFGKTGSPYDKAGSTEEHCFKFFEGIQNLLPVRPGFESNDGSQRTFDPGAKDKILDHLEQKHGIEIVDEPQDQCRKIAPLITLEDSCKKLRELHPNKSASEFPDQCKIIPVFYNSPRLIADPDILKLISDSQVLPDETIIDLPSNPMRGCPSIGAPSIPKIPLSKFSVIIPDIELPDFDLGPFFRVDLPDFIFEDLVFPDIELCNLDDCQFKFPDLSFEPPTLRIPEIKIDPIKLDVPGMPDIGNPNIEVSITPPKFSPLQFDFSQIVNLNSLVSPELELPEFKLPKPELELSFGGINADILGLLLGLLDFDIPNFSFLACMSIPIGTDSIPLRLSYPDYVFSWPAFPDIPEIPFCKDVRTFCKNANSSIQEIASKAKDIEKIVNDEVMNKVNSIQDKLDAASNEISGFVQQKIQGELSGIATQIEDEINAWIAANSPRSINLPPAPIPGIFPISPGYASCQGVPPLTINLDDVFDIDIGKIDINKVLEDDLGMNALPNTIDLKNVWPDDLKKIALSCDESSCDSCVNNGVINECNNYLGPSSECPSFKELIEFERCRLKYRSKECSNECKRCLSYELPRVPLCGLSYSREETISLPGFPSPTLNVNLGQLENATACTSQPPVGSACGDAISRMQTSISNMQNFDLQINDASKKIKDILQ